ncbi:MAG: acetylxylan esterase, partial [Planctomycetes bacterium]|nr:acetylxylan esterase [Planctomycetota bacterium]
MIHLSRREFISVSIAATTTSFLPGDQPKSAIRDVHQEILDIAAGLEKQRRARFAAVKTKAELEALQADLRTKFLARLDSMPKADGPPKLRRLGKIDGDDYEIEKLVFESMPGYFVSAVLYLPKKREGKLPGIISPCGHASVGKASNSYQILHINLAKRGFIVLSYDPVGQGERSQFWDAVQKKSRFNLTCGEHAMLGNPLYLLGTNLARYRIWDGIRALDILEAHPDVDAKRLGCVGASGGGTLTAYTAALDPRVHTAVIACYITSLPRRMGNRIERDPDSDPEQDIFGFVSDGIDHAGLLALRAPKPTQVNTARDDFFPIEGARESYAEAKHLFEVAGAGDAIVRTEAPERHGLSKALREGAYTWFELWLNGRKENPRTEEITVTPRPAKDLQVCPEGQVQLSFQSRPLLKIAVEEFRKREKTPKVRLKDLLQLDVSTARYEIEEI